MRFVCREIQPENTPCDTDPGTRDRRVPAPGSAFPSNAVARIFRPTRSVITAGKARTRHWILRFERRTPPFIDPLMGWTGGDDTLTQIELGFRTLDSAVAYAERQGLAYVVDRSSQDELGW